MSAPAAPAQAREPAGVRSPVAGIFRRHGPAYLRDHLLTPAQAKVLRSVVDCRTAALGGHLDVCADCGTATPSYNSCRDRHCPGCQAGAARRWLATRVERILPTHHFHVVFTLPAPLRAVALANPQLVYDLLFSAAQQTLQAMAARHLGAQLGLTAVLHTWTREMLFHPHLHCIVTGGGLSPDGGRWIAARESHLFSVRAMGALFRGKFMDGLVRAHRDGRLHFAGTSAGLSDPTAFARLRNLLYRTSWVVFAKRPFGGAEQVVAYLARYTHRVAISDARVLSATDERILVRTRGTDTCSMAPDEFIRRFLLHVLPPGFRKIRHYGLSAPGNVRTRLAAADRLLREADRRQDVVVTRPSDTAADVPPPVPTPSCCPACGSTNLWLEIVPRQPRGPP